MALDKIKKRNGSIVDFDRVRIERAMEKAFLATKVVAGHETLESITDDLIGRLDQLFVERIPGVEDVQDLVEKMLAERGFFDVAKAYILYRREHESLRESRKTEILEKIEKRVLIIGVGNTAMDCCRTAKRVGATDVKVMARRGREHFKASPWELEDAEAENVEIVVNHAPRSFVVEDGRLVGMNFDKMQYEFDARGNIIAMPTAAASVPTSRRVYFFRSSSK